MNSLPGQTGISLVTPRSLRPCRFLNHLDVKRPSGKLSCPVPLTQSKPSLDLAVRGSSFAGNLNVRF